MEEVKDAENEFFKKSSMSVVELNNYVRVVFTFLARIRISRGCLYFV